MAAMLCVIWVGEVRVTLDELATEVLVARRAPVSVSYHLMVNEAPDCMPRRLMVPATGVGV